MITFKLNNRDVSVPKGWTVMQAAEREGVKIPRFCWHPGLSIAGVCRFCMVKVDGRPKLEVACNLPAVPGMVVSTDTAEVKDAHKWALEYHLVNHPLDCPYCDQAGECGLQDYYMEVGRYKSAMDRPKVLKPKALDVGSELVLDTERCILCSRCVRFEEEVTKTNALGIFDRGDRAIVGTYEDETLKHEYQENLVDICPVGAFTSKKFRFKQRVWFLKEHDAICPGCETGCRIKVHARPERRRYHRIKPEYSPEVNGHWMCDKGRRTFEHCNPEFRLDRPWQKGSDGTLAESTLPKVMADLAKRLSKTPAQSVALLVSPQYTQEEFNAFFDLFVRDLKVTQVYQWREPGEDRNAFDGILLRGDHNANTHGMSQALEELGIKKPVQDEFDAFLNCGAQVAVVLAPEVTSMAPTLGARLKQLSHLPFASVWTLHRNAQEFGAGTQLVALKAFTEKAGYFVSHNGVHSELKQPFPPITEDVVDVREAVAYLKEQLKEV